MKYLFLQMLTFLLIAVPAKSQNIMDSDLVGTWGVTNFKLLSTGFSKEEITKAGTLKKSFLQAHFKFKADKHFSFDFDAADFKIQNARWKYNPNTKSAIIHEWKDGNAIKSILMELYIKRQDGKFIFLLSETPFILEVEKVS